MALLSLEETLGLTTTPTQSVEPTQPTEEKQLTGKALEIFLRRQKIIEYRQQGLTDSEICENLRKNDQINVSLRTIWEDRHSQQVQEYTDELIRQQLNDISECDDVSTRLTFRENLINILTPKKAEIKTENLSMSKQEINLTLDGLREEDKLAIVHAGRLLIKKDRSATEPNSIH